MWYRNGARVLLFIIVFFSINRSLLAQAKDWKDVSKEELTMKVYPQDSSASAVVLFDRADVDFNKDLDFVMNRHVRIKILTEEGYDDATAEIYYNDAKYDQEVNKVRGYTYTLNDKGNIKRHKLRGRSIFEEEISDGLHRLRFTLPALEPGAVIEYKYEKLIGAPYLLPDWEFQRSIPVAWSEYSAKIPSWFIYNQFLKGNETYYIKDRESFVESFYFTNRNWSRAGRNTSYSSSKVDVDGDIYT